MNSQLKALRELQQVNDVIRECEDEKAAFNAALNRRRGEMQDHQRRIDELQKKIVETKKQEDRHNLDLKSNEADINKLLLQLTQAKTNEEYSALNKRIEEERKQNSALEDMILNLMAETEQMQAELASVKQRQQIEQKELAAFEAKIASDISVIDRRIEEHRKKAAEIEKTIDPDIMDKYRRVFERMNGDVLAAVDGKTGICLGCHLPVTKQDINLILADNAIIFCKSCNRILYLVEDTGL